MTHFYRRDVVKDIPWHKTCFGCGRQFKFTLKDNPVHCHDCQDQILAAAISYMERNDFNTADLIKNLKMGAKK